MKSLTAGLIVSTLVLAGCSGGGTTDVAAPSLSEFDLDGDGQIDDEFIDPDGDGEPDEPGGRLADFLAAEQESVEAAIGDDGSTLVKNALGSGLSPNLTVFCDPTRYSNNSGKSWGQLVKGKTFTVTQGDTYVISVKPTGGTYASFCTDAMNFPGYTSFSCNCTDGVQQGITVDVQNNEDERSPSWYGGSPSLFSEYYVVFTFEGVAVGKHGMKLGNGAVVAQNLAYLSTNYKNGRNYSSVVDFYFNVQPGPDHLAVDLEPGAANVGLPLLADAPVVSLRDQAGSPFVKDGQNIDAEIDSESGDGKGSIGGVRTAQTLGGAARFDGLIVNGTVGETYTLLFRSGGLTPTSTEINIANPGMATQLVVSSGATVLAPGLPLVSPPAIVAADDGFNTRADWSGVISVSISGGDGEGSLSGTASASSEGGTVEFSELVIDGTLGETYTLTYSADGLREASEDVTFTAIDLEVIAGTESVEVGSLPNATFSTVGELLPGDVLEDVTYTYEGTGGTIFGPDTTPPTAVGTYSVTPSLLTFSAGSIAPYAVTYTPGDFAISPAVVVVAADAVAVRVGDTYAATQSLSRQLLPGDAIGSVVMEYAGLDDTEYPASVVPPSEIGSYSITPISLSLSSGDTANYDFRFAPGSLEIGVIPIEITVESVSVRAGETPELGYLIEPQLLEGDAVESVRLTFTGAGETVYGPSITLPSGPGTYVVTPSDLVLRAGSLDEYEVTYAPGTLSIGTVALEITADSMSVTAGEEPRPSFEVTGTLIAGDAIEKVSFIYEGLDGTDYTASTDFPTEAGTYSITPSQLELSAGDLSSYVVTYVPGILVLEEPRQPAPEAAESPGTTDEPSASRSDVPDTVPPAPEPVQVAAGSSVLVIDGAEVAVPLLIETGAARISYRTISVEVESDGDTDGDNVVEVSSSLGVSGTGFEPGSIVHIWIYSTPTYLGSAPVGADGNFVARLEVPSALASGYHALRVQATNSAVAVPVEKLAGTLPATGLDLRHELLVSVMFVGLGFALTSRRRIGRW